MAEPAFRIEHRHASGDIVVLGYSNDPLARIGALEPYAHDLLDRCIGGELVLIEQASGEVVAHRPVWLPGAQETWVEAMDQGWPC